MFILSSLLTQLKTAQESISEWKREAIYAALEAGMNKPEAGFEKAGMASRLAIMGGESSPDLVIYFIGKG